MAKTAVQMIYDKHTGAEAAVFGGIVQPFPQHFHDYYVIGITESGARRLNCGSAVHLLQRGAVNIFCPGTSHACADITPGVFYHKSFNLPAALVDVLLPDSFNGFGSVVLYDTELFKNLSVWHTSFWQTESAAVRRSLLVKIITALAQASSSNLPAHADIAQILNAACHFIKSNYSRRLSTEEICRACGVSASTLLRCFAAEGITPQRYLTAVRISKACQILQNGGSLTAAALANAFNDQSHFTNTFTKIMGVTPKAYSKLFLQRGGHFFDS